jgi:hypothetical protein
LPPAGSRTARSPSGSWSPFGRSTTTSTARTRSSE